MLPYYEWPSLENIVREVQSGARTARSQVELALKLAQQETLDSLISPTFICLDPQGALAMADALDAKIKQGEACGDLCGIPFAVKDNIDTVDMPTTGGSVLLAEGDPLLAAGPFRAALLGETAPRATLAYGEPLTAAGLHVIASETDHWVENLTGLCACGAHLAVGLVRDHARQGHPMMPVIQFAAADERGTVAAEDIDGFFPADPAAAAAQLAEWMGAVVSGARQVAAQRNGAVDFQLTRGLLGLTT